MVASRRNHASGLALLWGLLVLLGSVSRVQAQAPDPDKLSNDQPNRPLQMPPASSEAREAIEDFDRFKRRSAWERAAKALYGIPDAQMNRFVDGQDGFIIPLAQKRRELLLALPPEGQAAYKLFYDAEARQIFEQAEGEKEQANLEKLYSAYFLTTVGDEAADRLGDLYFERGYYDRAAACWMSVLRDRPDSKVAPALMASKAAVSYARAGQIRQARELLDEIATRFADETVVLAGRKGKAGKLVRELVDAVKAPELTEGTPPLVETVKPAWQFRFGDTVSAGMTPQELTQWNANPTSQAIPRVAVAGSMLFVNYMSHVMAFDLVGGKMLWRSDSLRSLKAVGLGNQMMILEPTRYALLASPTLVWSLGRDSKNVNMMSVNKLVCRRAETGEVVWQSSDLGDYSGLELLGQPILANELMYIAAKSSPNNMNGMNRRAMMMMGMEVDGAADAQPRMDVLAIRPHDGKIVWKSEVCIYREMQQYYYYGSRETGAQPRLLFRGGSLYIDTHNGLLARLDAASGALDWGYAYPTDPVQSQGRIFFVGMNNTMPGPRPNGPAPIPVGDAIVFKGTKGDRLIALDPDRMKRLWERPIAKSARLLGIDSQHIYMGGDDIEAIDLKTRSLKWSTPMPGGSEEGQSLIRPDGIWHFTTRGIFELDPATGHVRRIFRGDDPGASIGDLVVTDQWCLVVSNRSVSAYPRGQAAARASVPVPVNALARGSNE